MGNQGTQGTVASQGTQGLQGIQGLSNQGTQGAGNQGTQGLQGIQGIGSQGSQGRQGTQGISNQGTQGTFGPATIPQNAPTTPNPYVLVSSDNGKHISVASPVTGVTVNASVFASGENVVIYNSGSTSISIISGTNVTLRFASVAGTSGLGNRILAGYGVATLLCITGGATPLFVITGAGLI